MTTLKLMLQIAGLLALVFVGFHASPASGLPEFTRYGYFSCTSCHVASAGGGILTPYGRGISSERLAAWHYEGEERALHGAVGDLPEWFLIGGDVRQIQMYVENSQFKEGRYIGMQRDLEVALNFGKLWFAGTFGAETDPSKKEEDRYVSRRHFVRFDANDNVSLRAGRFFSKYGLMIPDHTSSIRRGMGFDHGNETDNVELTILGEKDELTVTAGTGRSYPEDKGNPPITQSGTIGYARFVADKHRLGVNIRAERKEDRTKRRIIGVYASLALSESCFLLSELDHVSREPALGKPENGLLSYQRLGFEATRGVIPFLMHQVTQPQFGEQAGRVDNLGLGVQLHPRPHFELELVTALVMTPATSQYTNVAYALFHYYL